MISDFFRTSAFLLPALLIASAAAHADPLFEDNRTLDAQLTTDLTTLTQREQPELTAEFTIDDASYPIKVRTRGKSRLKFCQFPPLWLDFDKDELDGSILANQNRIKLVTHCADPYAMKFTTLITSELLAYRLLNLLTPRSFRVRALNLTYQDAEIGPDGSLTAKKNKPKTFPAFLIEHKRRLGKRLELTETDLNALEILQLNPSHAALIDMFQFLIANTDYSQLQGPPGDRCCHNTVAFSDGSAFYPIPYDFDASGIVSPPYAGPNTNLGLSEWTQRRFRGICDFNAETRQARQTFIDLKPEIFALIENFDELPNLARPRIVRSVKRFYRIIERDKSFESRVIKKCR